MRRICLAALLAALLTPCVSHGAPNAIYNPATGNVQLINDTPGPLGAIWISSPLGTITGTPLSVPGAVFDNGDQPVQLTYINFPTGTHNIGNVVTPGTPPSELSGFFRYTITGPTLPFGVPEPSSLALLGCGGVALPRLRRQA